MKLLIMRHGETLWNTEGRLQGQTDIPLDEEGRKMAVSCGKGMKDIPVDLCISSPLSRARETAELVFAEIPGYRGRYNRTVRELSEELKQKSMQLPCEVKTAACEISGISGITGENGSAYFTDARLKEAGFGPWEGLICRGEGYNVPLENFSTYWSHPESPLIPEGVERLTHVAERVEEALKTLSSLDSLKDKTVLLVVHGCVMRSVVYIMSGRKAFLGKVPLNCEIIEAEPDGKGGLTELGRKIYYDKSMVHDFYATMKQE